MTEEQPAAKASSDAIAKQLDKTAEELRTLGEQLGAIEHTQPKEMTLRRARITSLVVVTVALLIAWLIWSHWHSLLAATAPLIWIFWHARRLHQRRSS